ncbi:uncharacterized protein LOC115319141 [Ixodes scapularis]|uniref:uncharacterized protein LOC115319141 n=1 Tax=Ixodes scapularis TaxID=6945 RepID=UPI001A9CD32E|nr:uncharacterized protein LOC115319141 [Ixodes scapularis]
MQIPDGLYTEVGLFCVLLRTVFPKLPPEQGLSTVRRVRRCLRALLDVTVSPTQALASRCVASCELSAAFILRRLNTGHQSETLLMLLATLARIRALLLQTVPVLPAATSDQSRTLPSSRSDQVTVLEAAMPGRVLDGNHPDSGHSSLDQDLGQPVTRHEVAVAKLKRLYRRLKTDAKKPSLLRKTCLRGLRDIRAGRSSLLAEAKKMRAAARKGR